MRKLLEAVSTFLEMCENLNKEIEVEIPIDRKIIKGTLRNTYLKGSEIYVELYDCEVKKDGEFKNYHKIRIPLLRKFCKYRFL